ncbi:MAG: hypothetical protein EA356_00655 [Geminicoccaceae bacterium]|nr:MAG: hypothetical protein EA356_00655 [Geminicoccaceae bacterium]
MRAGRRHPEADFQQLDHGRFLLAGRQRRLQALFLLNPKATDHPQEQLEVVVAHRHGIPILTRSKQILPL